MIDEKQLDLLVNLGSYKPKYFLIRILIISLVAVLLIFITKLFSTVPYIADIQKNKVYIIAIMAFNSVSELNLLFIRLLSRSKRSKNIYFQSIIVLASTIFFAYFWVEVAEIVLKEDNILRHSATQIVLVIGWLVVIIHLLVSVISNLTKEWIDNRKVIDELKQAKLISDYNSLKDRLNPHFLFNNLSVLKSLIRYSPNDAEVFTQNFTNVYRYVLNSHDETLVQLQEEIRFLESYVALHKERIGEGLFVNVRVNDEDMSRKIPPLSLQLLVENAIKHNTANKLRPLHISIYTEAQKIIIKNNLNKKDTTYSTNTGLKTLRTQYKLIADEDIYVVEDDRYFVVKLPLI